MVLGLAAPAAATTIVAPVGSPVPYQRWADESKVATPQMTLVVDEDAAICAPKAACTGPGDPIWINPWLAGSTFPEIREVFVHELGHHFDYYVMEDWARARFQQLVGDPRPWTEDPNAPNEKFAEAYRFCALVGPRLLAPPTSWGYAYRPYRNLHAQACHLIRRVAN